MIKKEEARFKGDNDNTGLYYSDGKMTFCNTLNNHTPSHYRAEVDTIDYIHMHRGLTGTEEFCIGNILKYATRYGKKDEKIKEIEKIIVYANRLKEKLENE